MYPRYSVLLFAMIIGSSASFAAPPAARQPALRQAADTRMFWLDQLPLYAVSTGYGSPHWDRSNGGNPLTVQGVRFTRGLGTHAHSKLSIRLFGDARRFVAKVGVDDEMSDDSPASIEFILHGDGKILWRSGIMHAKDPARPVDVSVAGIQTVTLEVTDGGNGIGSDHGDWCDARFIVKGRDPVALWPAGAKVVRMIRELRAFQTGQRTMTKDDVMKRVRTIEKLFPALVPATDEKEVRPLLESIRRTGDLPQRFRTEEQSEKTDGRATIWLESLGVATVATGYGEPHAAKSSGGNLLSIGGKFFHHGLGVHAVSRMLVNLHGDAQLFSCFVGVDDEMKRSTRASIEFVVKGDDKILWRSGVMRANQPPKPVSIALKGVNQLLLEVTDAGDGIASDHADWADAKLVVDGRRPTAVVPPLSDKERYTHGTWTHPLDRLALTWDNALGLALPPEKVRKSAAADYYPGPVPPDAPRITRTVTVDLHTPFWHGTGLYAAPGEPVTIRIPPEFISKGLKAQVGCFTDRLWAKDTLDRAPEITRKFALDKPETVVACAYGGLIYIDVPAIFEKRPIDIPIFWKPASFQWVTPIVKQNTPVKVTISSAVEAPRYVYGKTSLRAWREIIRKLPAPVAEIESNRLVWSVRSKFIRKLDDPDNLMKFWTAAVECEADLASWDTNKIPAPMRIVLDRQISAGGGHSGYPIMAYESWNANLNADHLWKDGTWGAFHELGHNHQWSKGWTFQGQGEVTVNLFSLYVNEKLCHRPVRIRKHPVKGWDGLMDWDRELAITRKVYSLDPRVPGKWAKAGLGDRLAFHVQLVDAFGWDAVKKVIASYRPDRNPRFPATEEGRAGQYMVRLSRIVGRNLYPYFYGWGLAMPADSKNKVADLPVWQSKVVLALQRK